MKAFEAWYSTLDVPRHLDVVTKAMLQFAWQAATERAAKIADKHEVQWHSDYKTNGAHRGDPHREGMSDGATRIADAIRSEE